MCELYSKLDEWFRRLGVDTNSVHMTFDLLCAITITLKDRKLHSAHYFIEVNV